VTQQGPYDAYWRPCYRPRSHSDGNDTYATCDNRGYDATASESSVCSSYCHSVAMVHSWQREVYDSRACRKTLIFIRATLLWADVVRCDARRGSAMMESGREA
jgi:hypothetical protein